jgi:hypothetical protein
MKRTTMKKNLLLCALLGLGISGFSQVNLPMESHPDTKGWDDLFKKDLSDAEYTPNVWTFNKGILTADKDEMIFSKVEYENFVLDFEFNMESGANSGVVVYCTDKKDWIPNSVEIQIADDTHEKWAKSPGSWQCGAIFGHLAPSEKMAKEPGNWNHMTIACVGQMIYVVLNGKPVTTMDMSKWTSAKTNPDGSEIPPWLSTPFSELKTKGFLGLQGKHADAKVYFRNVKIKIL